MSDTITYKLGYEASISFAGVTIAHAKDVTISGTFTEVDVTTRADAGKKAYIPGLEDCDISFDLVDASATEVSTLKSAYTSRTAGAVAIDGVSIGNFFVMEFPTSLPLDDTVSHSVKLRPAPAGITAAAASETPAAD